MKSALPLAVVLLALTCSCAPGEDPPARTRPAALAGQWYPSDPDALRGAVQRYMAGEGARAEGRLAALVVPHAGYVYSGAVAGSAWRLVPRGAFDRVVLLGPSHYGRFAGFSLPETDAFATPLGAVRLDATVCDALRAHPLHARADRAHDPEHCIEIQLPFLQAVLPEARIVPILIGAVGGESATGIAAALAAQVTPRTLVVISTDFTHYGPNFDYVPFRADVAANLRKLDMGAVEKILARDGPGFDAYCAETQATICGRGPISILLRMLAAESRGVLVKYDTSGRMTGDYSTSVSYVSLAFTLPATSASAGGLTDAEKRFLLRLARQSIEQRLTGGRAPEPDLSAFGPQSALRRKGGAFVTLKKGGQLRGCIGRIAQPGQADVPPLYETVRRMSVESATADPRFPPVTAQELKGIEIEISALTPAEPVSGPEGFQVGRHGIIIRKGFSGAVFLPQVATEQGWTRDETLAHLCRKAGLPADEWKRPGMTFHVFTAEVFGEDALHP